MNLVHTIALRVEMLQLMVCYCTVCIDPSHGVHAIIRDVRMYHVTIMLDLERRAFLVYHSGILGDGEAGSHVHRVHSFHLSLVRVTITIRICLGSSLTDNALILRASCPLLPISPTKTRIASPQRYNNNSSNT